MLLPSEPHTGQEKLVNDMRLLIRAVRALTPVSGPGMRISQTTNGTVYESTAQTTGATAMPDYPFRVTPFSRGAGFPPAVRVAFGTVNNLVPGINGVPLFGKENANGQVEYPALDVTEDGYIILKCGWHVGGIGNYDQYMDGASIIFAPNVPADEWQVSYRALAYVGVRDGVVSRVMPAITASLWCERYAVGTQWHNYLWSY